MSKLAFPVVWSGRQRASSNRRRTLEDPTVPKVSSGESSRSRSRAKNEVIAARFDVVKSALANAGMLTLGERSFLAGRTPRDTSQLHGSRYREKEITGVEERCRIGASGDGTDIRTDDEASRAISYRVRSFVRSVPCSHRALQSATDSRLLTPLQRLPLRSVPVPPLARKTESNDYPHSRYVGRSPYGTVQSRSFVQPCGRVTWDDTGPVVGRVFRARASFRIERAHERDDAFCPTREKLP